MSRTRAARMGRALTSDEKRLLAPYIPLIDLEHAAVCEGWVPWYLPKRFVAIVRGRRIYLRPGVYQPGSAAGLALLGHELMHVHQYRTGMNAFSYLLSALRGHANSRYERAAFDVQARISANLGAAASAATGRSSRE